jgi:putative nucleotidyltransferase with HDIG domain
MKMFELISWFQMEYPELVVDMKKSNHHLRGMEYIDLKHLNNVDASLLNPYHIESDVWTHTMMVCKQAENMPYEVQIAALLHDIGKPSTRKVNEKNGRVSFYNHDAVGAFMALEILKRPELELNDKQIARIFNTIALHTQIYKLDLKQLGAIRDLCLLDNLTKLGKADHEGRFHSHEGSEIPTLKDIIFNIEEKLSVTSKEVTVLCGLPCSGKSRWTHNNMYNRNTGETSLVISRDMIVMSKNPELSYNDAWNAVDQKEVNRELDRTFIKAKNEDKVIVDMTNMSKKSRRRALSHFGKDYKKKCVVFLTDLPTIDLRNKQRDGKLISKEVYDRMMRSFYPPTYEEFDEIEYVIGQS